MKTLFIMHVDSAIDLITNSSSELFVFEGMKGDAVINVLDAIHPTWRYEYDTPKNIADLTVDELNTFFDYAATPHMWPAEKSRYPVLRGFTFDELYEPEDRVYMMKMNQYRLKNNLANPRYPGDSAFVTEENRMSLIEKLNPDKDMWFMFSKDENPNWDMQERLMKVASRYHLG